MNKQEFKYEIGGAIYRQRPLVLGQIEQLLEVIRGLRFRSANAVDIIADLGPKLSRAIAVVLIPDGVPVRDRDLPSLEQEIRFSIEPDTAMQVVEDFFTCNPLASLLERAAGMAEKISRAMAQDGSTTLSQPSATGTLQKETQSSGASHLKSANHS